MASRQVHTCPKPAAPNNPYLHPNSAPMGALSDGTPLYPAYHPVRPGDRRRVLMRRWDGSTGEWYAVTLGGRLFRQTQYWGSDSPRPNEWREIRLT